MGVEAAMNHALKHTLVLTTALLGTLAFYYLSFQSANVISYPGGGNALSVCGIKIPYTPATNDALNRVYAPLCLWRAAHQPKKTVRGTLRHLHWGPDRIMIVAPEGNIGCLFDQRLVASLQKLKEGDEIRATIGWAPGREIHTYDYKLESISAEKAPNSTITTPQL